MKRDPLKLFSLMAGLAAMSKAAQPKPMATESKGCSSTGPSGVPRARRAKRKRKYQQREKMRVRG